MFLGLLSHCQTLIWTILSHVTISNVFWDSNIGRHYIKLTYHILGKFQDFLVGFFDTCLTLRRISYSAMDGYLHLFVLFENIQMLGHGNFQ